MTPPHVTLEPPTWSSVVTKIFTTTGLKTEQRHALTLWPNRTLHRITRKMGLGTHPHTTEPLGDDFGGSPSLGIVRGSEKSQFKCSKLWL